MKFEIPAKAFEDHFVSFLYAASILNDGVDVTSLKFDNLKPNSDDTISVTAELRETDDASEHTYPIGFMPVTPPITRAE